MGIFDDIIERQNNNKTVSVSGIAIGIVKENWNKDVPGTVRVELQLGEQGKNMTGWIPVVTPYGGEKFGQYTLPELGSEVVVAFNMGDRNCPIVIGSIWGNKSKQPEESAVEKNTIKRFKTKGGNELIFDDEDSKAKITLTTPGKLNLFIDDEKKSITVSDEAGDNAVIIDAENGVVELAAKSKIVLSVGGEAMLTLDGQGKTATVAAQTVKLEAKQSLSMEGKSDAALNGAQINVKAQGTLKMEASGMSELKGGMVKIN